MAARADVTESAEMTAPMRFTDLVARTIFDGKKRVEPEPRMVGGSFGYAFHRFPIKGGISPADVMAKNVLAHNALYRRLAKEPKK